VVRQCSVSPRPFCPPTAPQGGYAACTTLGQRLEALERPKAAERQAEGARSLTAIRQGQPLASKDAKGGLAHLKVTETVADAPRKQRPPATTTVSGGRLCFQRRAQFKAATTAATALSAT
jgi:hypothetical protein